MLPEPSNVQQSAEPRIFVHLNSPRPLASCPCGCNQVRAAASDTSVHYAAWRCINCDKWRGWVEKPYSATKRLSENQLIEQLLDCGRLSDWETQFCQNLKGCKKRSPRQLKKLEEIAQATFSRNSSI